MKSFTEYLKEEKNLHMEHLEDAVFNEGSSGVVDSLNFASEVIKMLSGKSSGKFDLTV